MVWFMVYLQLFPLGNRLCEGEPVKADGERIIITEEEAEDGSGIITTLR